MSKKNMGVVRFFFTSCVKKDSQTWKGEKKSFNCFIAIATK